MERIRIGVIGTGFGARVHIPGFLASGEFQVVGVVSHSDARARAVAERFAIPHAFTDHRDLLALAGLDAVSVTSTPDLHPTHVIEALAAGKHVLCEKPLARNLDEARRMAAAAQASSRVAMVDHEFRWQPERRRIKELIDEGFLGTPYSATAVNHMGLFSDPERPAYSWWQESARGGGWLLNSGTHLIDSLRWWLGEIEQVAGFATTKVTQRRRSRSGDLATVDADDAFGALLRFRSGADAVLHQSAVAASGRTNLLELCGSEGVLLLDPQGRLLGARRGEPEPVPLDIPERLRDGAADTAVAAASLAGLSGETATAALRAMELPPFVCNARAFASAIRTGSTPEPSITDAAKTQEVCEAIARSAREGRWLTLPL